MLLKYAFKEKKYIFKNSEIGLAIITSGQIKRTNDDGEVHISSVNWEYRNISYTGQTEVTLYTDLL